MSSMSSAASPLPEPVPGPRADGADRHRGVRGVTGLIGRDVRGAVGLELEQRDGRGRRRDRPPATARAGHRRNRSPARCWRWRSAAVQVAGPAPELACGAGGRITGGGGRPGACCSPAGAATGTVLRPATPVTRAAVGVGSAGAARSAKAVAPPDRVTWSTVVANALWTAAAEPGGGSATGRWERAGSTDEARGPAVCLAHQRRVGGGRPEPLGETGRR